MKRLIALLLASILLLTGCTSNLSVNNNAPKDEQELSVSNNNIEETDTVSVDDTDIADSSDIQVTDEEINEETVSVDLAELNADHVPEYNSFDTVEFNGLDDPELLSYMEKSVTEEVMNELDPELYKLNDISVTYISKEYVEELAYNSQSNIFFGYTLEEVDAQFQGTRYVFSLGDDGTTVVKPFEAYDDTYEQIIKNVAIGTGVILICVTVSAVTGGATAPAVSYIFVASAKTAAEFALSSAAISGIITTGVTAYQTGDMQEAVKQGALSASNDFKWGAILGGVAGAGTSFYFLKTASQGGLTLNEVATIVKNRDLPACFLKQISSFEEYEELAAMAEKGGLTLEEMANICMTTGYPLKVVKCIKSVAEENIYVEEAGLTAQLVGDEMALVREIDLTYETELNGNVVTNLERMKQGYAAIDPATGEAYELHHIGQKVDSPLAILSAKEHRYQPNNNILHDANIADGEGVHSLMSDSEWATQRQNFWKNYADLIETTL